ncbi:hypothetical protein Smar_1397 [Staphylothermus marinus F1]|uniref:Membrane protein insertase YidC n=1 Tax=Staphylothermus marinus (strain ATCC 43588 / DSM 3639 / JCM 9404 / F1) TaxID=399550 RepID=A3DPC8_STAMF|nr:hypothetical protein [Staphylothermus marinus]ABN70488.1 hypothetical protein Smar_1397 [Staphylothermus marinus F1]
MKLLDKFLVSLLLGVVIASILSISTTTLSAVTATDNTVTVTESYLKITWDLDHGGAIQNIQPVCSDFKNTPVAKKGIAADRGGLAGKESTIHAVMWDIISDNNPWEGYAVYAKASYEVLKETPNYTTIQITYTLPNDSPFAGLKVIKTYRVYNNSFIVDFNMTLTNTGTNPVTIDLSDAWGRPVGPMIELVSLMGSKQDEYQFMLFNNGKLESYYQGSSWGGAPGGPVKVDGTLKGIGIYDNTTDPSPWGFMIALFMADDETVSKTSYVWFETSAGGSQNTIIRVEFKPLTLNPGDSEEYHMKIYAGPLHREYLVKEAGFTEQQYKTFFYNPAFSPKIPCRVVAVELKYPVNVKIVTEGGTGVPKAAISVYDYYSGTPYVQTEIESNEFTIKIPYNNATYTLGISPQTGTTRDGYGEFIFKSWILPNGTEITGSKINVTLKEGDTITLKFGIRPLAKLVILFVSPDGSYLPQQAETINFTILGSAGELLFKGSSAPTSRNITALDQSVSPPRPGFKVPGIYVIQVPLKAGVYTLSKIMIDNTELQYTIIGDKAQATFTLDQAGKHELKVVYSTGGITGGGGGLLIWIIVVAALIAIIIIALLLKKKK